MRPQLDPEEFKAIFVSREEIDTEQYIIVHYKLVPSAGFSLAEAAARTCIITSLRTVKPLPYESSSTRLRDMGRILNVQDNGEVIIAFPINLCSVNEGLTQLLVISAFGADFSYTDEFWIEDIELPKSILKNFQGPKFGIKGVRNLLGVPARSLIGVSIKPRIGVPLSEVADVCRESLAGGADFIVDDLLLVDPDGELAFEKRVPLLSKIAAEASKSERKLYFVNISTSPFRAMKLAEIAKAEGAGGLVVNAFAMGLAAIEEISKMVALPIITTNMGDRLYTRPGHTGLSSTALSQFCRLAGVDAIHAGTSSSECYGPEAWGPAILAFRAGFHQMLPDCFAVAEGDITIADVWDNIYSLGPDVLLEVCSGIIGYPGGPRKGAHAFRMLVENLSHRMSLEEAHNKIMDIASIDPIVKQGLDYYGYQPKIEL